VNNHAHIIQGTNGLSTELLYVFCKNMRVESIINGAVQLKINQRNLLGFDIVIPKKEFLLKLDNLIQPLFEKVRKNNQQIQTLQATRDTLLPKLMSGKVRVDEFKE
jgi:type I restriction enzyme S subunit